MAISITITDYLEQRESLLLVDVRSPGEFQKGHIPGARSLPLFTNEERSVVGTAYKQQGRKQAIKLGLQFFGPKMVAMVEQVESWLQGAEGKTVALHCWRGGMRSAGVAWLLELYGIKVCTIRGGYKSWRRLCVAQFERPHCLRIVGGFTGSQKTDIVNALKQLGEAALDLEALASHRGSAFGAIGMAPQPTQEMFENRLALELLAFPIPTTIWVEDESQRIGCVNLPFQFYRQMKEADVFRLNVSFEQRLRYIMAVYGKAPVEVLANGVDRIKKRLGGLEAGNAKALLEAGDVQGAFSILLHYYDKFYQRSMLHNRGERTPVAILDWDGQDPRVAAAQLIALANTNIEAG